MRIISFIFLAFTFYSSFAQKNFSKTLLLMGSRFDITVVCRDTTEANEYFFLAIEEIKRIEKLISSWDPQSQTSSINQLAGIRPVKVDLELFNLIERAVGLSKLTDGAFDISYASMDKIWKFDGSMDSMPSIEQIKASVSKIGYQKIVLNKENQTVYLKEVGMKIGFGAIGKGYAADQTKALLINKGLKAGIINAAGDMNAWGKQANGENWLIAISNPFDKNKSYGQFLLNNSAVVTSGDYEKYVSFNGLRYSHIIDPRTGYPATGIISVTVFAPKAELADALATSVFVMGIESGLDRINQIPNVECIVIAEDGTIFNSKNIAVKKL